MPRSKEGLVRLLRRQGLDDRVVDAFARVDRRDFVPRDAIGIAYADRPVALSEGQTTSQPTLIARMIEAGLGVSTARALEVGTGYGFQTALLAVLFDSVVSVERSSLLAGAARNNLGRIGITNARVFVGDGWEGLKESAPFDTIVVSAAATEVPAALQEQLAEGGRLVIPVKGPTSDDVMVYEKRSGEVHEVALLTPARFVPLVPGTEQ